MICPYCSEDIEPIELNGKTFCSNCGLTINTEPPKVQISHQIKPIEEAATNDEKTSPVAPVNPIMSEPTPEADEIAIAEQKAVETPIVQTGLEEKPTATETTSSTEAPILMDILNNNAIDMATPEAQESVPTPVNFEASVQNIDNLGTAGILLDILGDEQAHKAAETERAALEAAEELLDEVNITTDNETTPTPIVGAEKYEPQNGMKLKVDVLDNSIVNPTIHPEIEAAPEELDLPLPPLELTDKNIEEVPKQEEEIPTEANEAENLDQEASFEELISNIPSQIPDMQSDLAELQDESNTELTDSSPIENDASTADNLNEIPSPIEVTSETDIKQSEVPAAEETKVTQTEAAGEEEYYEKLGKKSKEEVVISHKENLINELMGVNTPETSSNQNHKSEHLKDYFSSIMSLPHSPEPVKKKATTKKKAKHKKKAGKKSALFPIIAIFMAIITITAGAYFIWQNENIPATTQTANVKSTGTTFEAKEPQVIPYGYQKGDESFDKANSTHQVEYNFINDKSRKLTFKQINTGNVQDEIKKQINGIPGSFEIKEVENTNMTIFENGTTIWGRDNFVYIIEVQGATFKDQIEKMALSVE